MCTTSVTSSTWMPRAAMSVATSTRASPPAKAARLRWRAAWLRLPCRSTAWIPAALSVRAQRLAWCLVRAKARVRPWPPTSSCDDVPRSAASTVNTWCSIAGTGECCRVDLVGHRVVQVAARQDVDAGVERRREQQPLTLRGGLVQQAPDLGQEPEIRHVVGLVDDGHDDRIEARVPLVDEVGKPSGRRDDDVRALGQCRDLGVLADAAEDGARGEPHRRGERGDGRIDLHGQLTGRHEDEPPRPARGGAATGQRGHQGQRERHGLSAAGAPATQDVTSGQGVRQRRRLDGEGRVDAAGGQGCDQRRGDAEVGEAPPGGEATGARPGGWECARQRPHGRE